VAGPCVSGTSMTGCAPPWVSGRRTPALPDPLSLPLLLSVGFRPAALRHALGPKPGVGAPVQLEDERVPRGRPRRAHDRVTGESECERAAGHGWHRIRPPAPRGGGPPRSTGERAARHRVEVEGHDDAVRRVDCVREGSVEQALGRGTRSGLVVEWRTRRVANGGGDRGDVSSEALHRRNARRRHLT
jgi:hypothetical protein